MRDPQNDNLKLGKGVEFVKSELRRIPQSDEIAEADRSVD